MPFTKEFKQTVANRIHESRQFRECLLQEAVNEILHGDVQSAKSMLRDFINATITFKELAQKTGIGDKSLMRMLGEKGNPTLESLSLIIKALEQYEKISFIVSIQDKTKGKTSYDKRR